MTFCIPHLVHAETIQWVTPDYPPYYIVSGDDKGTGTSDFFTNFFILHTKGYEHQRVIMKFNRFMLSAQEGLDYCFADLLKTPEREELFHYSAPINLAMALRVYVRRDHLLAESEGGSISFSELLQNEQMTSVFEENRSYSTKLDTLIEANRSCPNVAIEITTPDKAIQRLVDGRIDYILEYPHTIAEAQEKLGSNALLTPLRIKEQPPYTIAYVTCTKTPKGVEIIQGINKVLSDMKKTPEYKEVFMYPAKDLRTPDRKEYNRLYETFLEME